MLAEMAVSDSYGIAFEFCPHSDDRPNNLRAYYQHPTYGDMIPGCYTDDTQRSLANAELILRAAAEEERCGHTSTAPYNPLAYAAQYQEVFKRDPRPGYSRRFEAFLKENLDIHAVDFALKLNRKPTNGAVMGSAVLGYLPTPEKVMLAAASQALSTHSFASIPYAQMVALAAHYFIYVRGDKHDLSSYLYKKLHESSKAVETFLADAVVEGSAPSPVTMGASSAVKWMLFQLPRTNSLAHLTKLAIDSGGDTDSSAAISVAVASESLEYVNDLPDVLVQGLENGEYGRDYLIGIDRQLNEYARNNR